MPIYPDDRGADLIQIMHRIYRELLLDAAAERNSNKGAGAWQTRWVGVNEFEKGINHGMMTVAAGFITRVIRKCSGGRKIAWSIIAHTHECEELRAESGGGGGGFAGNEPKHAHVCGFYAIKLEENGPTTSRKLTFPCVSATDAAWVTDLAVDIYDLFVESGASFVWAK